MRYERHAGSDRVQKCEACGEWCGRRVRNTEGKLCCSKCRPNVKKSEKQTDFYGDKADELLTDEEFRAKWG